MMRDLLTYWGPLACAIVLILWGGLHAVLYLLTQ